MKQLFRTMPYKYSYLGVCISLSCVCIRLSCVCIRLSCVRISLKKEATDKDVEKNACPLVRLSALPKRLYSCREARIRFSCPNAMGYLRIYFLHLLTAFLAIRPIQLSFPLLLLQLFVASHERQYRILAVSGAMGFVQSRSVGWWSTSVAICLRKT